jgi:DNA-binding transcriptional ArsR family regulator
VTAAKPLDALYLLGDPTRLRIVSVLASRGDVTGTELTSLLGVSQGVAAHHLGRLYRAGLVSRGKEGQSVPYRLDWDVFAELASAVRAIAGGAR